MKDEKAKIQKSLDELRAKKSAFIRQKMEARRKELQALLGDAASPDFRDTDLLTAETLQEVEAVFNEAIAAQLEALRQLDKAATARYFETVPASIEKLTAEVEQLAATLSAKEAELKGLENSLKDYRARQNANIDRPIVYTRQADKVFDPRLAAMKGANIGHVVNY